jgi:hypothetical protein
LIQLIFRPSIGALDSLQNTRENNHTKPSVQPNVGRNVLEQSKVVNTNPREGSQDGDGKADSKRQGFYSNYFDNLPINPARQAMSVEEMLSLKRGEVVKKK